MIRFYTFAIAVFFSLSALSLRGAEKEICAEGIGCGTTRQEALHDAMRKAIRNAVGMYVSTKSVLSDNKYQEEINIASDATVTNYEELSVVEKDGMWMIKIRARILPNELLKYCPKIASSKVTDTEIGNILNKRDAMKNADKILDEIFQDYFVNMFVFKKTNLRLASDDNVNSDNVSIYIDFTVSLDQKYFLKFQNRLCALLDRMAVQKIEAVVDLNSYNKWPRSQSQQRNGTLCRRNGRIYYSSWNELMRGILPEALKRAGITLREYEKDFRFVAFNNAKDRSIYYTLYIVHKNLKTEINRRINYYDGSSNIDLGHIVCSFSIVGREDAFRKFFDDCLVINCSGISTSSSRDWLSDHFGLVFANRIFFDKRNSDVDVNLDGEDHWAPREITGTLRLTMPVDYVREIREIYIYYTIRKEL